MIVSSSPSEQDSYLQNKEKWKAGGCFTSRPGRSMGRLKEDE